MNSIYLDCCSALADDAVDCFVRLRLPRNDDTTTSPHRERSEAIQKKAVYYLAHAFKAVYVTATY